MGKDGRSCVFKKLTQGLEKINPLIIMRRGYALVETENNQVINSIKNVNIGQKIKVNVQDGTLITEIKDIEKREVKNEV